MRKKNRKELRKHRREYRMSVVRRREFAGLVNKAELLLNDVFGVAEDMQDRYCGAYYYQNIVQKIGILYSIRLLQENGFSTEAFELPCAGVDAVISNITPEKLEECSMGMGVEYVGYPIVLENLPGFECEEIFAVDGDWSSENIWGLQVLSEFSGTEYENELRNACSALASEVESGQSYLTMYMLRNKQLGHFLTIVEKEPRLKKEYPELIRFVYQCESYMANPYYHSFIDYMATGIANNEWVTVFTVGYSSLWEQEADLNDVFWASIAIAILLKAVLDKAESVIPEFSLENRCRGSGCNNCDNKAA